MPAQDVAPGRPNLEQPDPSRRFAPMKWVRDNGLTLALGSLFLASIIGHFFAGWATENQERVAEGAPALTASTYFVSGPFLSSVFENWESEFLQMAAFVVLTGHLYQRGSPESRDPDGPADPPPLSRSHKPDAPWPARVGGLALRLYAHSLGLVLFVLFALSFTLHWTNSARAAAEEAMRKGEAPPTLIEHLVSAELWFESFQNWQSEFLSTAVLVVLAIFLREHGSPESKSVDAPHAETGAS